MWLQSGRGFLKPTEPLAETLDSYKGKGGKPMKRPNYSEDDGGDAGSDRVGEPLEDSGTEENSDSTEAVPSHSSAQASKEETGDHILLILRFQCVSFFIAINIIIVIIT